MSPVATARRITTVIAIVGAALGAGCASGPGGLDRQTVDATAFRGDTNTLPAGHTPDRTDQPAFILDDGSDDEVEVRPLVGPPVAIGTPVGANVPPPSDPSPTAEPVTDATPAPEQPTRDPTPEPTPPGPAPGAPVVVDQTTLALTVDSLVGQINGEPIYASDILEEIGGVLRAMADEGGPIEQWAKEAGELIELELTIRVRDALMLAEARSSLSTEQRKGLLAFLDQLRDDIVRDRGGSIEQTEEFLNQSQGVTLDQAAQDKLNQQLIQNELRLKIQPRVNVTPREVLRRYERDYSQKYSKPGRARFLIVYLPGASDAAATMPDRLAEVRAGTTTFADLAASPDNIWRNDGVYEIDLEADRLTQTFFSVAELNDVAQRLEEGETSDRIEVEAGGSSMAAWLHLARVDEATQTTLYDAQLEITAEIREEKFQRETMRYFSRLLREGSYSSIDEMRERLLVIAAERYLQ